MNYSQALQFLCIAKHRNMTKASEELFMTQPALSQSLGRLENELGLSLFYRSRSQMLLSDAGKKLLPEFQRYVAAHEDLLNKVLMIKKEAQKSRISIGYSGSVLRFAALNSLNYSILEPLKVVLSALDLTAAEEQLSSGTIDFALTYPPLQNLKFSNLEIDRERIVLAVPRDHPLSGRKEVSLSDLRHETFISQMNTAHFRRVVDRLCAENHFTPVYVHEYGDVIYHNLIVNPNVDKKHLHFAPESIFDSVYSHELFCKIRISEKNMYLVTALSWVTERHLDKKYPGLLKFLQNSGEQILKYNASFARQYAFADRF